MTKKLIIAGSRSVENYEILLQAIKNSEFDMDEFDTIVSGCALGADSLGIRYAMEHKKKVLQFPVSAADWRLYGRAAGPIRNKKMAETGDALIALWDGESKGTENMIASMQSLKKPVFTFLTNLQPTLDDL